jgi:hypothetical protein
MPVVAFRFLAQDRLVAFASGPWTLAYSMPAVVLLGLWLHCARGESQDAGVRAGT